VARDSLTSDTIVRAAIDQLDAEGLEGLSMRSLGERLGSAATAVYWHVGSKDNLISLAADSVWAEVSLPTLDNGDWRASATQMAKDLHAMLTRHVWLVQAFGSYLLFGPGKARHDDHILALYETAGFGPEEADRAAATVFTFVLGNALGPAAASSLNRKLARHGNAEELLREGIARAKEVAADYPYLRARLDTTAAEYSAAPEQTFEFGLNAILDGLEIQLGAGGGPPGPRMGEQRQLSGPVSYRLA